MIMIQVLLRNEYINPERPIFTYTVKEIFFDDPHIGYISLIDNQGVKRSFPSWRIIEIIEGQV